jgi:hypothetical protein
MSAMNLRERILLYYIALNDLFIKNVLIFLLDEIILHTDIRDSIGKISTDYAFKKTKKSKNARKWNLKFKMMNNGFENIFEI